MREGDVVIGTVRAKREDGTFVVVKRDGSVMDIAFEGEKRPLIGGDVVGRLHFDDYGAAKMVLRDNALEVILEGPHKVYVMGKRPDLTARMLGKVLARSKSVVVSPGDGIAIERTPLSDDDDLNWAMNSFKDESERRGVALNILDVRALAKMQWEQSTLRDMALPADIEGGQRTLDDLTVLLRSGFRPYCSRVVDKHTDNSEISVNFILPYSPFLGATGFARRIASMGSNDFPITRMETWESRRFASARTIALGMAHNCLGARDGLQADVENSPRARHLAACFADAVATLKFLADGYRSSVVAEIADLKEASLHYGRNRFMAREDILEDKVLEEATHKAIRAAMAADLPFDAPMKDVLSTAARIAKKVALPATRFGTANGKDVVTEREQQASKRVASNIGVDLSSLDYDDLAAFSEHYRYDLQGLIAELGDNENSAARLALYESYNVPDKFKQVLEEEAGPFFDLMRPTTPEGKQAQINRDRLADRVRSLRSEPEKFTVMYGETTNFEEPGLVFNPI